MAERQHAYGYDELLACGRGELFGPGNAQLPLPPMLMFDRITLIDDTGGSHNRGQVRAELDVNPDLYGARVRLAFVQRLRGEQAFAGVEALVSQIGADVGAARSIFERFSL